MYQHYFGLTNDPFPKDLCPEQIFQSKTMCEAQERFKHLCSNTGIMLLTGMPGSGKTTALRCLIETLNRKTHFPVYLPLSTVSVFEFYRQLNASLGGTERYYKADIYRSIQSQIISLSGNQGLFPIVVLDEAHLLKEQNFRELQIIVNFEMDSVMPFSLIIAGHPVLQKRLQSYTLDSFNQRILLKYAIDPLTEKETVEYIESSLKRVGAQIKLLTESACKVTFQKSRGLPRLAGALVNKALLHCAQNRQKIVDADDVLVAAKEVFG